jgi:predicted RNase H-like nuclease (RuvC/YqgF family)
MEWLYVISALASAIAAALAWAAKLWWGREFSRAKDEIIRAREAQIEVLNRELQQLREMTPMKIREYFLSVREQLEEYNEALNGQLVEARKEIDEKSRQISVLQSEGQQKAADIARLEGERNRIQQASAELQGRLTAMRERYEHAHFLIEY